MKNNFTWQNLNTLLSYSSYTRRKEIIRVEDFNSRRHQWSSTPTLCTIPLNKNWFPTRTLLVLSFSKGGRMDLRLEYCDWNLEVTSCNCCFDIPHLTSYPNNKLKATQSSTGFPSISGEKGLGAGDKQEGMIERQKLASARVPWFSLALAWPYFSCGKGQLVIYYHSEKVAEFSIPNEKMGQEASIYCTLISRDNKNPPS